jgi:hypothetical protein
VLGLIERPFSDRFGLGLFDLRPCYLDGRSQIKVHTDERTQVHSAQSSLAVTHPGTNRAGLDVAQLQWPSHRASVGRHCGPLSVRGKDVILQQYKSLVRPHLEWSIQARKPHYQKDITLIEGVQRRATKLISGTNKNSYEETSKCEFTLETRRIWGNLIEVFEIFKGFGNLDSL